MAAQPLHLTSWLDDQNGPAKLTARQLELVAGLEEDPGQNAGGGGSNYGLVQVQQTNLATNKIGQQQQQGISSSSSSSMPSGAKWHHSDLLTNLLVPDWEPNEIIKMFHEERQKIIERGNECKSLLENTDLVLNRIVSLKDLYLFVSPKTSQLHSQCKSIIQERNDLKESFDRINTTLNKQEELRSIFKRMPDIKNQIMSVLESVCQSYQNAKQQPENSSTPLDEYYGRFFIECRRIKELTSQLESCLSTSNTDELLLHLEEIYTLYFDIRNQLIEPVFTKNIRTLVSKADRNYCDLLRQTSTSLIRVLRNEIQLFNQIFPSAQIVPLTTPETPASSSQIVVASADTSMVPAIASESRNKKQTQYQPIKRQAIDEFLDLLCRIFYGHLRPVVIHINHLETLTELYKLVMETMRPEVAEEPYKIMMQNLAEDIQERMVFRAEVFIQESVLDYKPSSGDLAYPEKLEIVPGGELKDYQSMWYPTVQRAVLALFYLNRVFDPLTFRELAQEVVMACFKSLDVAQRLIDQRHNGTKIEATLFLSKHLAIIKDQLQSYGIERIQFQAQSKSDPAQSELVEIETSSLESLLKLFQDNEFNAASSESLWSQLNETIVSGTKWTLRATRIN